MLQFCGRFLVCVSSLGLAEVSHADIFSSEVAQLGVVQKMSGKKLYIPIAVGDITFFVVTEEELAGSMDTVAGEDSDSNGIRDDVQNAIMEKYQGNTYVRNRTFLMARRVQAILTGQTSSPRADYIDIQKLQYCIEQGGGQKKDGQAFIFPAALNTYQRSVTYLNSVANALSSTGTPLITGCD